LAQGMLTGRYLNGIPEGSRASQGKSLSPDSLTPQNLTHVRALNAIAEGRGQTLAQMAIAWVLRDPRMTSALIGASSAAQIDDSLGAVANLAFSTAELDAIDHHAVEGGINLWRGPSTA
ncbi:MAG: aldo/keto reductase, partial [Propionibacteriaceae bacterium]